MSFDEAQLQTKEINSNRITTQRRDEDKLQSAHDSIGSNTKKPDGLNQIKEEMII